ncbi:MAG TPA: hypothetical protein VNA29_01310 [Sphingomicrobium sp.]|nr:hypothetical protein [Sphingomicrobium sp.]
MIADALSSLSLTANLRSSNVRPLSNRTVAAMIDWEWTRNSAVNIIPGACWRTAAVNAAQIVDSEISGGSFSPPITRQGSGLAAD